MKVGVTQKNKLTFVIAGSPRPSQKHPKPTINNKDHHHLIVEILHPDVDADSGGEPFELGEHLLHPQQLPSRLWQEGPPQLWYTGSQHCCWSLAIGFPQVGFRSPLVWQCSSSPLGISPRSSWTSPSTCISDRLTLYTMLLSYNWQSLQCRPGWIHGWPLKSTQT